MGRSIQPDGLDSKIRTGSTETSKVVGRRASAVRDCRRIAQRSRPLLGSVACGSMSHSLRRGCPRRCVASRSACRSLLALAAFLPAQDKPRPEATPVFRSDVSLVLMPVFVIDKDGQAVRGLTAADFEVQQDGRPAEVVSFRYVDTTDVDEQDELRVASAARRRFLLLFDKSFTDLPGLERSRRAAGDFVQAPPRALRPRGRRDLRRAERDPRGRELHRGPRAAEPRDRDARRPEPRAHQRPARRWRRTSRSPTCRRPRPSRRRRCPRRSSTASRAPMMVRMRVGGRADVPAQRRHAARGARQPRRGAARRRGAQADPLLLGRLRLARAGRAVGLRAADRSAKRWPPGGSGRWTASSRFGDSRLRETLGNTTRNLAAADTVVHSIDVTGLGSDDSLTRTAVEPGPRARHHEPRDRSASSRTRRAGGSSTTPTTSARRSPRCSR